MRNAIKAFTLAEVLITLGIIGVVVAMTLPTLINSYKKQQTVTHLQKVYTSLNQALRLAEAKYGPYEYWEIPTQGSDSHQYYEKYWYPYFKILKSCETYSQCGYKSNFPWLFLNGSRSGTTFAANHRRVPFILSDGTLVSISIAGGNELVQSSAILVDLNGNKLPNKYGIDFFIFSRVNGKGILPSGYTLSNDDINENCSNSGIGNYCAAKIISDGWQIGKDYPWK